MLNPRNKKIIIKYVRVSTTMLYNHKTHPITLSLPKEIIFADMAERFSREIPELECNSLAPEFLFD